MEKLGVFLSALGILLITAVLLAWPTQWLWNNVLIGAVDGVHPIGFWQALGINILFNMLFKNNK
jgi:hypothetical protein